ncbi:non-ribosomal peptide synthetase [Pseudoalteromonas luteoviolacea]|uniref:Amino acid adenylation domain protein n=1 Tax=Pseudoalteromonas luteoviolacea (strain 2ta16) TaxID=1353533 RepID=V4H8Z6_PSEL2|nr:non-ribosomal peptide synthetase [Pseudoalteromonas luteoviolacea]ESP93926.1 amino acid adenylation domain protein [Pseudoalteromonas luteoviolacea 2ta16]KZN31358.1 hypothetical protein N483_05920 [Pseudoalteromonas luteoviolacea NCIMB 1944]
MNSIVDVLQKRALSEPQQPAFTFIDNKNEETISYAELDSVARDVAGRLSNLTQPNEPVLLLCPPGLEFIKLFFACLYAGRMAVPLYPPRLKQRTERIKQVVENCNARIALTSNGLHDSLSDYLSEHDDLQGGQLFSLSTLNQVDAADVLASVTSNDTAFIQYTSGSTGTPKGVVVRHDNIVANIQGLEANTGCSKEDIFVNWLPLFHDLGLVNTILLPVYFGAHSILMAPAAFVQKPSFWLQAISKYRGTICGAPNFAYDLCVDKIQEEALEGLDLSCWKIAFNAAEPIHAATLERFVAKFNTVGFSASALYPSYGMAEATVFISGGEPQSTPVVVEFDKAELANRCAKKVQSDGQRLVSCGQVPPKHTLKIVDQDTKATLPDGQCGEIWVSGPSIAQGYWGDESKTAEVFNAFTSEGDGPFLRTGDLGFVFDDDLYIAGRIKDVLIVRGANYYPQDIEKCVSDLHPAFVNHRATAFTTGEGPSQRLVVVQEVFARAARKENLDELTALARQAVAEQFDLKAEIVCIRQGTLSLTSSGKVQRANTKMLFESEQLITLCNEGQSDKLETPLTSMSKTETQLHATWQRIFNQADISIDTNFFALGGDSLDAAKAVSEIERTFAIQLNHEHFYAHPTIRELATEIDKLSAIDGAVTPQSTLSASGLTEAPASYGQQALWVLDQIEHQRATLKLHVAFKLQGKTDIAKLEWAINQVITRHTALRTRFIVKDDTLIQQIVEPYTVALQNDLATVSTSDLDAFLQCHGQDDFDLERGHNLQVKIAKLGDDELVLSFLLHHIVFDAWSAELLIEEINGLYNGQQQPLAEPALSYIDCTLWQKQQGRLNSGFEYWQDVLTGAPELLLLPYDRPRNKTQSFAGSRITYSLDASIQRKLESLAASHQTTLYTVMLSAYQVLLYRLSGSKDIVIGTDSANRQVSETMNVIGYFVNQLVLRQVINAEHSLSQLIADNHNVVNGALNHQHIPFDLLVDNLKLKRNSSYSPLFQTKFILNGKANLQLALSDVAASKIEIATNTAQFDLTLSVDKNEADNWDINFHYNTALFDAQTVERFLADYLVLLEQAVSEPSREIKDITLASLCIDEYEQAHRGKVVDAESIPDFVSMFEQAVAQDPDKQAVVFNGQSYSYAYLNQLANQFAHFLQDIDVSSGAIVGVHIERSLKQVVVLLALAKCGATFLPLDPAYPVTRIRNIIADDELDLIVTTNPEHEHLSHYDGALLELDDEYSLLEGEPQSNLTQSATDSALVYRLYTSGSSGVPKGVNVSRRSFNNLCNWYINFSSMNTHSVVFQPIPLSFDASIKNIFAPLMCGATLVLPEEGTFDAEHYAELIATNQVTHINCVPSLFYALVDATQPDNFSALHGMQFVAFGGEATDLERLKPWLSHAKCHAQIANIYGPTECTDISAAYIAPAHQVAQLKSLPIGKAIDNMTLYVVDEEQNIVPTNLIGEVLIAGAGVSEGYHNRASQNESSFIEHAVGKSARFYRTGDLMKVNSDGLLEYQGRVDEQIKINGMRVETAEIEALLQGQSGIASALVAKVENQLVAYYETSSLTPPTTAQLKEVLKQNLHQNWIPKHFVHMSEMPLLPNGKIDRDKLANTALPASSEPSLIVAPENDLEQSLHDVWCQVLEQQALSVTESFFDLGGDSITAVRVIALVKEQGYLMSVADIFEQQSIRNLCQSGSMKPEQTESENNQDASFDMLSEEDKLILESLNIS